MTRSPEAFAEEILAGSRSALARGITLVESRKEADRERAAELLRLVLPAVGGGHRIGISGPPGVGKSTLIDALGLHWVEEGRRVAVLAVDPSSSLSGGSILGDKSRMSRLALEDAAFIRPSPSDLQLGGVTRRTREVLFLCEAAGFDHLLVETVGVGQSEIQAAGMVDTFVVLIQPGAGDELQGIKKGILELADLLVVTKADGANAGAARKAVTEYSAALRYLGTKAEILATSARSGEGIPRLAELAEARHEAAVEGGALAAHRARNAAQWLLELAEETLLERWRRASTAHPGLDDLARRVLAGELRADEAARRLLEE